MLKNLNKIDKYWLIFLCLSGLLASVLIGDSIFSVSVLLSGVCCVALIAIGRVEGYWVGIYQCITYAYIAYGNGLFGEVMLNLGFYLPTSIIGIYLWNKNTTKDVVKMRALSWKYRLGILILCILFILILGYGLSTIEKQNNPYMDATTNVLSVIATFLMLYRYLEQWFLYFTLNIVSVAMWVLRWQDSGKLENGNDIDLMIIMWILFLINSIYGSWRWYKGSQLNLPEETVKEHS